MVFLFQVYLCFSQFQFIVILGVLWTCTHATGWISLEARKHCTTLQGARLSKSKNIKAHLTWDWPVASVAFQLLITYNQGKDQLCQRICRPFVVFLITQCVVLSQAIGIYILFFTFEFGIYLVFKSEYLTGLFACCFGWFLATRFVYSSSICGASFCSSFGFH